MTKEGLGPKADHTREELSDDMPVLVEVFGTSVQSEVSSIHDPEYITPSSGDGGLEYRSMTLSEARKEGAEFCCDCFERAWIDCDVLQRLHTDS
jgi:hypothetical protein